MIQKHLLLLFFCAISSLAMESDTIDTLSEEMESFAKTATNSKQNIDYLPFIVSVWDGEKLSKMGARTLKDAINLLPGVDFSMDNVRNQSPIFRGSNPFAYGQSKLIIDGVVVNDRTFDGFSSYLDMPIELVKRLEVVRGAGSFAQDANGYAGSIKVVTINDSTNKSNGKAFILAGTSNAKSVGLVYDMRIFEWKAHTDFYFYDDSAKINTNGNDGLANHLIPMNVSLSKSGYAPIQLNTYSIGSKITNDIFTITGRATAYKLGSAFGNLNALPNEDGRQKMPSWYFEVKYDKALSNSLALSLKTGIMQDGWESYSKSFPDGISLPKAGGGLLVYPNGYWGDLAIKNQIKYAATLVNYSGLEKNSLMIGVRIEDEKNIEVKSITTNKLTATDWYDYSNTSLSFFDSSAKRKTLKLFISDTYNATEDWAFSCSLNSDKADDFSIQNDYRVAAVWQVNFNNILKFMTATAYRAPSWQEIYVLNNPNRVGSHNLKPERVKSYEIQHIYKFSREATLSSNFFVLQNKNQINRLTANTYQNAQNSLIYGGEIEYKKILNEQNILTINYSFADGKTNNESFLPATAKNMVKATYLQGLGDGFSAAITALYVGEKKRIQTDSRENTPSYLTANAVLNYDLHNYSFQLEGKNIFNTSVVYPSEKNSYKYDYPTDKRQIFLKLLTRF